MEASTWGELARLRQGLYRCFGAALLTPDDNRLSALEAAAAVLDDGGIDAFAFAGPWRAWHHTLAAVGSTDAIVADHVGLLVAGVDGPVCSPFESDYLGVRPGEAGTITAQLARDLRQLGLAAAPSLGADHVAAELEVMAVLCERESEARAGAAYTTVAGVLRDERTFLRRHLGRWFSVFAARLARQARTDFFRTLAPAAHAFVHHDGELVEFLGRVERGRAA